MNTETVRSLALFVRAVTEHIRTKGEDKQAIPDARYYMGQAIETEQDLRDAAFVNEVQRLDHLSLSVSESRSEHKVNPVAEAKKPVTPVVTPVPAVKSATSDLTVKKSGLVNS